MSEGLKIISLDISNIRKIKAFNMTLDGANLHVAGYTGEGKTTAINALWEIMSKNPDTISHGERKGVVRVKLAGGGRTVLAERVTTQKSSTVKVTDGTGEEGKKVSAKDFNDMMSGLAVNPHKIRAMEPRDQVAALLQAAKVDVDLDAIAVEIGKKEALRLEAYRDAERAAPAGDRPDKVEAVSVAELLGNLDKAEGVNRVHKTHREALTDLRSEYVDLDTQIETLTEQIAVLKKHKETVSERIDKGTPIVAAMVDEDVQGIKDHINAAEEINRLAAACSEWEKAAANQAGHEASHEALAKEVRTLQKKRKDALDGAQWPLEGLTVVEGDIVYKGALLRNLGESEQMLVCAALAMNDILAHDIRVVRMDGVESMSQADLKSLVELFNGHDIQVLSTRVSRGDVGEGEIEIVDGRYGEGV